MKASLPPRDKNLAYLHDGTMEGFFSAVFEAYARKENPERIAAEADFQQALGQVCTFIDTDESKADRVKDGIISKLGQRVFSRVFYSFLSSDADKDTKIFRYIVHALATGRKVLDDITHGDVEPVETLYRNVGREEHYMRMFVRFSEMEGGTFFAKINPKANVLPLIMEHFASRFNVQPFIIYDEVNHLAGVYDGAGWYLQPVEGLQERFFASSRTRLEDEYRYLWKRFFDSIAIEERKNYAVQRGHMPKRFWRNLTEVSLLDKEFLPDAPGHLPDQRAQSPDAPACLPDAAGKELRPKG